MYYLNICSNKENLSSTWEWKQWTYDKIPKRSLPNEELLININRQVSPTVHV